MSGAHRAVRRVPRWIGLVIIALMVFVFSYLLAPMIAHADAMPPAAAGVIGSDVIPADSAPCAAFGDTIGVADPTMVTGPATDVRAGRHPCYDRLVIDVAGPPPGWSVKYVDALNQDATGRTLTVPGGKIIEMVVRTNGHDITTGRPTLSAAGMPSVAGFASLRSVVFGADFEGQIQLGVGVVSQLPFRVVALAGTGGISHVVLDVAHPAPGAVPVGAPASPAACPAGS